MKVIRSKPETREPLEDRFNRFAKALMAVPKKELDKELGKPPNKKSETKRKKKT
jgi:hypothetical protein